MRQQFKFRYVDPVADAELLHNWFTQPRGHFWGMGEASVAEVTAEYAQLANTPGHDALFGLDPNTGEPLFLTELYDPFGSPLADISELRQGDIGMHLFVGPPTAAPISGFSLIVMKAVLAHAFDHYGAQRVIVEPDASNTAIHVLNARAGFQAIREVDLQLGEGKPTKRALLSIVDRRTFKGVASHLSPEVFGKAERHLCAKLLGEFIHERLLEPTKHHDRYRILLDDGGYIAFAATCYLLDHWVVDPASIEYCPAAELASREPRTSDLIINLRSRLPLTDDLLPLYLEEIQATLASLAVKLERSGPNAKSLAYSLDSFQRPLDQAAAFQHIESAMTEGHPCFVANSGRHGMGASDLASYAPESGKDLPLQWLAVSRSCAHFSAISTMTYQTLWDSEWSASEQATIAATLQARGLCADDYFVMPAHPWQVEHKVLQSFAAEVARNEIVLLGASEDLFRAQQSLRTFFNVSNPQKFYAKTALSVVNMGFMRGLSAEYMKDTPAINEWLTNLFANDVQLQESRVGLIREVCAVGYRSPLYTAATAAGSPYRKMLSGLWRESPVAQIVEGEELATMASLLHRDNAGISFVSQLIERSGESAQHWLQKYLAAYLIPVVHCLAAYRLAFMPHGENVILVLRNGLVDRVIMKDIGEEIAVLVPADPAQPDSGPVAPLLPSGVDRIYATTPSKEVALCVFTDVFDCFFRFLAPIMAQDNLLAEETFWSTVRQCLENYFDRYPGAAWLGLFDDEFELSCLNRLQLRNNRHMLDLSDQSSGLQKAGLLSNPISST